MNAWGTGSIFLKKKGLLKTILKSTTGCTMVNKTAIAVSTGDVLLPEGQKRAALYQ